MKASAQQELFRRCVDDHAGIVWRLAHAYATGASAEDLAQEIWLQVWRGLPRFAGRAQLSTWLYQVALRTALTWRRKLYARGQVDPVAFAPDGSAPAVEPTVAPDQHDDRDERRAALRAALQRFPEADRALLLLWLEGLPYREIAGIVGLSESNVGVRLNRLKNRLHQQLAPLRDELA